MTSHFLQFTFKKIALASKTTFHSVTVVCAFGAKSEVREHPRTSGDTEQIGHPPTFFAVAALTLNRALCFHCTLSRKSRSVPFFCGKRRQFWQKSLKLFFLDWTPCHQAFVTF